MRLRAALLVVLVCGAGAASAASGPATSVCAKFDTVLVGGPGGDYIYQQDEWNSSLQQCATVRGQSFTITKAGFQLPTNGPPATYPSFYRGCHWGACSASATSGLPKRVGALKSVRSTWLTRQPATGAYDVSFDVWTNKAETTSGQPDGSEVMIWLNSRGGVQPFGSRVGTVTLAGARWAVWAGRQSAWNIVSYRRLRGTTGVRNLNVKAFLTDSVRRGYTKASWFVLDGEAGFEIWQGGKGLATTSFSFDVR
jgi:hypothetical protein